MADCKVDSSDGPKIETKADLPDLHAPALEENEEELFKMRAKLYRWATEADPPQWKERGTGDVKLLQHKTTSMIRLLMRRDKTFKVCANHYVDPDISLKPHGGSDRAWVWNTFADFADGDEESQKQLFAIRFLNEENANKFKDKFTECQDIVTRLNKSKENSEKEDKCDEIKSNMNIINDGIDKLTVKEKPETDSEDKDSNVNVASPVKEKSEECNNNKNCNEDKQPDNTNSNKPNNALNTSSENSATKLSKNENDEEDEPEK